MHSPAAFAITPVPPKLPEILGRALTALVASKTATWSDAALQSHRTALRSALRDHDASVTLAALGPTACVRLVSSTAGTFDGTGEVGALVLGGYGGHVYTGDLTALRARTVAYAWHATNVHAALLFLGKHREILGHFQGGGLGVTVGVGCGEGGWR